MNRTIKAILFITIMNVVNFFLFNSYYESYEGLLSSFVHGTYTQPCINDWNNDVQFLLLSLYAFINQVIPDVQFYGIILFVFSWLSISLFGIVIYKILNLISPKKYMLLFLLLYLPFSIDNILNLSSTRIAFYLALSIILMFEYYRYANKEKNVLIKIAFLLVFITACLMRFEIVVLCSLCYIIILFVLRRFHAKAIIPFFLSLSIFVLYTILISQFASEAKKTAFYKEKQFIDRNDIEYAKLPTNDLFEVEAFRTYHVMDEIHFKLNFYNRIAKSNFKIGNSHLLDGVSFKSFKNIMSSSIWNMKKVWYYILVYLLLSLYISYLSFQNNKRFVFYTLFLSLFPVALCSYVLLPDRFLSPYFMSLSCLNILICFYYNFISYNKICIILTALLLISTQSAFEKKKQYMQFDTNYLKTLNRLNSLQKINKDKIIINEIEINKYFPVNPFRLVKKQNVLFLNTYFFGSYQCYIDAWHKTCSCNAISLKEKVFYVVDNKNKFIIDKPTLDFLKRYLLVKYRMNIFATKVAFFDENLDIYQLDSK